MSSPSPEAITIEVRGPSGAPPAGASRAVLERGAAVGRYLVVAPLGRGSMGEVYSAYDPELDRRVALKLLHTSGGTEQARLRLFREARARQALPPRRGAGLRRRRARR